MKKTEHPAWQNACRKLCKFLGILMNTESVLKSAGFDLTEAYAYASREHNRLDDLAIAAGGDPRKLSQLRVEEDKVESVLFERMNALIDLIQRHQPDHALLPGYLVYRVRWRECLGEPARPLTDDDQKHLTQEEVDAIPEPPAAPLTYGVEWEKLDALRSRLAEIRLAHAMVAPYVIFLCGLKRGWTQRRATGQTVEHAPADGLRDAARDALQEAVDFAFREETGEVAAREWPTEELAVARLYMGVGYAQKHHSADVFEWLHETGALQNSLLRLLFGMGVRAATDLYARQLVVPLLRHGATLGAEKFGSEVVALVESFA